MSTNKMSQDAKKEEFKKYLEKAGVLEVLTKSLVSLYEEPDKPGDAVSYLKKSVGGTENDKAEIEKLQSENAELKAKVSVEGSGSLAPILIFLSLKLAAMEEKQSALKVKLSALEKSPAEEPSMEESSEPPAAAPAEEAPAAPEAPADITEKEKEADPVPVSEPEEPKGKTV